MTRRWIIRGLALMLLTVCVVAWVGSYWKGVRVLYSGDPMYVMGIRWGRVLAYRWTKPVIHPKAVVETFVPEDWRHWDLRSTKYHWGGFAWASYPNGGVVTAITIPFWFLSLVSGLLLVFLWRRTRSKYNGPGFPVEVGGEGIGDRV